MTRIEELEKTIGIPPQGGSHWAVYEAVQTSPERDKALVQWLIALGIPAKAGGLKNLTSKSKAYAIENYLREWRKNTNPGWEKVKDAIQALDLDAPEPQMEPEPEPEPLTNSTTAPVPATSSEWTLDQLARATDQVLSPKFQAAEQRLSSILKAQVKEVVAATKLELTDAAKAAIVELARNAGRELFLELMPPKRIEILDHKSGRVQDLGIQHEQFPTLLKACTARNSDGNRLNILLAGPAGTGKTSAAKAVSTALGLEFYSDSSLDADFKVVGYRDAGGNVVRTQFFEAFTKGGIYCADEIDNWSAAALTALNPAFGNGFCAFPDGLHPRHPDCVIIACANTWGLGATSDYVGRQKLDAATLDRLQPKISWGTDEKLELAIAANTAGNLGRKWCQVVQSARAAEARQGLKIIISPHATFSGIALIQSGFSPTEALDMTITANLSAEQKGALNIDPGPDEDYSADVVQLLSTGTAP